MNQRKEEPVFVSYKGMGYVSMFFGVPLSAVLIMSGAALVGSFVFMLMFGAIGLIWPVLCAFVLLCIKELCATDNKALERTRWIFKAWRLRLSKVSTVLTVSPNKIGSQNEHIFRRLKKIHRSG